MGTDSSRSSSRFTGRVYHGASAPTDAIGAAPLRRIVHGHRCARDDHWRRNHAGRWFALLAASRLGLGRLPGDFAYEGKNVYVAIPIATSILLSIVLTIALNIAIRVWK